MMNIKLDAFNYLLECGADVNAKNNFGSTLLHECALCYKMLNVAESLLKYGADVNAKDKDERTPLIIDSYRHRRQTMTKILLKYGADVNAKDKYGKTPLHYYLTFLHNDRWHKTIYIPKIKLMLDYGADVNAKDNKGETPLLCSAESYSNSHKSLNVIKLFLEHDADINAKNNNGENILHVAVKNERIDIIRFLLKYNKIISTSNITE